MSSVVNTKPLSVQNNLNNNQAKLSTATGAATALTTKDTANVSSAASGAYRKTFTPSVTGLQSSVENMAATLTRIRNEVFAQQSANLARAQFTQHPLTAMLAQANQSPQDVLALLR